MQYPTRADATRVFLFNDGPTAVRVRKFTGYEMGSAPDLALPSGTPAYP